MPTPRRRTKTDHLAHVEDLAHSIRQLDRELARAVGTARRHRASWDEVGQVLGVSRQAAWERFGRTGGDSSVAVPGRRTPG